MATYSATDNKTGKTITFEWHRDVPPTPDDINEIVGAASSMQAADSSTQLRQLVHNIPRDALETVKQIAYPVTNTEDFMLGMSDILGNPNARRQVWSELKKRYGGYDAIKNYAVNNPVQFGMDVSSLLTGVGALGKVGQLGKVAKVASVAGKVGEAVNPLGLPTKALSGIRYGVGKTGLPEQLYESALNPPLNSLSWARRRNLLHTLLRQEKMRISEKSYNRMAQAIDTIDKDIANTLQSVTNQYGSAFDVQQVLDRLENLKSRYQNRPLAHENMRIIDEVKQEFANHGYVNGGWITVEDAHQLKKGTYAEIKAWYDRRSKTEAGRGAITNDIESVAKAEAAYALRKAVADHPDVPKFVKSKLKRQSGLMSARKWVERALSKGEILDVKTMSGMVFGVLTNSGVKGAAAWKIASSPKVMSLLALQLAHGNKTLQKMGAIVRPSTLGTFQFGRMIDDAGPPADEQSVQQPEQQE